VTVTGAGFFSGRVEPTGVEFQIGNGYYRYGPADGLSVRLSPTTVLTVEGLVNVTRSMGALIGSLEGAFDVYDTANRDRLLGECRQSHHGFTLTPVAGTSSRRR
jgi:hypothetical protein